MPPHMANTIAEVVALTCFKPPGEVTHWTEHAGASVVSIVMRSVQHREPKAPKQPTDDLDDQRAVATARK